MPLGLASILIDSSFSALVLRGSFLALGDALRPYRRYAALLPFSQTAQLTFVDFSDASYDGDLVKSSRDYCLILSSRLDLGNGKKEIKSKYAHYKRGCGDDRLQLLWTKPFGEKMQIPMTR